MYLMMVRYLDEARRASIYSKLTTPGLSNREIADTEGITAEEYGALWYAVAED